MGDKSTWVSRLRKLKETVLNPPVNNGSSREKNENAYAKLNMGHEVLIHVVQPLSPIFVLRSRI